MRLNKEQNKFIKKLYEYNEKGTGYWTTPTIICSDVGIQKEFCEKLWHSLLDEGFLKVSQGDNVRLSEKRRFFKEHPILFFLTTPKIKFIWGCIVFTGAILGIISALIQIVGINK